MKAKITVKVEVDGEIYMFTIQRRKGDLSVTSQSNLPAKIQNLVTDLWAGHAPSTL